MLLSATVGNSREFLDWSTACTAASSISSRLRRKCRSITMVPDQLLNELVVEMCKGDDATRKTPALVFCFNRDACWNVAEQLKGLDLLPGRSKTHCTTKSTRSIGTAGRRAEAQTDVAPRRRGSPCRLLPKYRRVVEKLFAQKLLAVCVCTERWRPASTYRRVRSC